MTSPAPEAATLDLSVIVVNWNTREMTLACLEHLAHELRDSPVRFEVIAVDNGSEDGSAAALRALAAVDVIALPTNCGFAAANNAALPRCRGQVVLLLNSDALMSRAAVEACLQALDRDAGLLAVGPQLVHPDGRLQNSVHAFPSLWTELLPLALLETLLPARFPSKRSTARDTHQPVEVDALQGAAFFVRRSALAAVGGLPAAYFFFLEETDLCWMLRERGGRVALLPGVRVEHALGASSKRRHPAETLIEYHRSLYTFLDRRRGAATRRCALGLRVARAAFAVGLGALGAALGLGGARLRERAAARRALLAWHFAGRPSSGGLAGREASTQPRENEKLGPAEPSAQRDPAAR